MEGEVCCEDLIVEENIKSEGPPNANPAANTSSSGESIEDVRIWQKISQNQNKYGLDLYPGVMCVDCLSK